MTESAYQDATTIAANAEATPEQVFEVASALDADIRREKQPAGTRPADAGSLLVRLYERAADGGVTAAWPALSAVFRSSAYGPSVKPDERRALTYDQQSAEIGDATDLERFARAVHFAEQDSAELFYSDAATRLNAALGSGAESGLMVVAAWMLQAGEGYAPDAARARALLQSAADQGNPDAHFELYIYAQQGIGGPVDESAAVEHILAAADGGNVRAMANLGGMYATGRGVPLDEAQSVKWYRRAAHAGHPRAAFNLSVMYATGDGALQDAERSERYRALASELGYKP